MNHEIRSAIQAAGEHLATAGVRHELARSSHSEARGHLRCLSNLIEDAQRRSKASAIAARLPDIADARSDALTAHAAAAGALTRAHRSVAAAAEALRQVAAQNDPVADGALGHLDAALDRHEAGRALHATAGEKLARTQHALDKARSAATEGRGSDALAALDGAADLAADALNSHGLAGAEFAKSRGGVKAAADRLERALAPDAGAGAYVEPTHDLTGQGGAQVSEGREPRARTPEEIRARDQLRGCRASYNAEIRRLNGGGHRR